MAFTSESIENIPAGFRARQTYVFSGSDQFEEIFEIAEPGKDFEVYSRSRLTRVKQRSDAMSETAVICRPEESDEASTDPHSRHDVRAVWRVAVSGTPTVGGTSNPFFMRILDEQGQGIPNIRVVSDNGIVCRTQADGSVRWTERSVMNDVRFRLDSSNGRRDVTLHPTAGGRADVSLKD